MSHEPYFIHPNPTKEHMICTPDGGVLECKHEAAAQRVCELLNRLHATAIRYASTWAGGAARPQEDEGVWITGKLKPTHHGVYRRNAPPGVPTYAYWDGSNWCCGEFTREGGRGPWGKEWDQRTPTLGLDAPIMIDAQRLLADPDYMHQVLVDAALRMVRTLPTYQEFTDPEGMHAQIMAGPVNAAQYVVYVEQRMQQALDLLKGREAFLVLLKKEFFAV